MNKNPRSSSAPTPRLFCTPLPQWIAFTLLFLILVPLQAATVSVSNVSQLVNAVNNGAAGDTINVAAGTYLLTASLTPKANMTIRGAGADHTILRNATSWNPGTGSLPDNAIDWNSPNRAAYLFDFGGNSGVQLRDMTLDGRDQLHGAVYGAFLSNLVFDNLLIRRFIWSGIRTWEMGNTTISNSIFEDAGGRHGGITGGCLFLTWVKDSTIHNNRFYRTTGNTRPVFGIKGRETRRSRYHNNTILLDFAIEFPFENDHDNEIDHNYLAGAISIPKDGGGGTLPASGITFHIHHNYFTTSYALEWNRRGARVNNNLFDFQTTLDGGNLISSWSDNSAGGTHFHDNLIKNPGRGVFWAQNIYNNFHFYNNHVIANKTVTPRTEGLFGFNTGTNFSTITIRDNIIECIGQNRPLVRNSASHGSVIQNNTLTGISDTASYSNPNTGAPRGPTTSMVFNVGVNAEYLVNNWQISQAGSLPSPWASQDIGNVGASGSTSLNNGIFTVAGSGADIWGTSDAFRFAHQSISGDVTITARVTGLQNTHPWAKAGVMIRESLNANSKHAMVVITPSNGASFQRRTTTGGISEQNSHAGHAAPHWVRITRTGNVLRAYRSTDGSSWTQVGADLTLAMSSAVHVGLAVTSHAAGVLNTATFDNVTVTSGGTTPPPPAQSGVQINTVTVATNTTLPANLSTLGTTDWAVWNGWSGSQAVVYDRKASGTAIGTLSYLGGHANATAIHSSTVGMRFSYSNGTTHTGTQSNVNQGIGRIVRDYGGPHEMTLSVTVPGGDGSLHLLVSDQTRLLTSNLTATLGENSDTVSMGYGNYNAHMRHLRIDFSGATAGQILTIKWTAAGGDWNSRFLFNAAALSSQTALPPPPPASAAIDMEAVSVKTNDTLTANLATLGNADWRIWNGWSGSTGVVHDRKNNGTAIGTLSYLGGHANATAIHSSTVGMRFSYNNGTTYTGTQSNVNQGIGRIVRDYGGPHEMTLSVAVPGPQGTLHLFVSDQTRLLTSNLTATLGGEATALSMGYGNYNSYMRHLRVNYSGATTGQILTIKWTAAGGDWNSRFLFNAAALNTP